MKRICAVALLVAAACSSGSPSAKPSSTIDPAYCPAARVLENATVQVDASLLRPALLRPRFGLLSASFAGARAHAPASLKPDYDFLSSTLTQFGNSLRSVGFDFTKLSPVLRAIATSRTGPVAAARARIRAFGVANCGIPATPSPSETASPS
ncbi:MAG: hypothetical protein ABR552_11340 [Actinomycetota bacterium]